MGTFSFGFIKKNSVINVILAISVMSSAAFAESQPFSREQVAANAGFSRVIDRPDLEPFLGEMWKRDGLIYGDVPLDNNGEVRHMNYRAAGQYCSSLGKKYFWSQSIGARLPDVAEPLDAFTERPAGEIDLSFFAHPQELSWTSTPSEYSNGKSHYLLNPLSNTSGVNLIRYRPKGDPINVTVRCVVSER